MKTSTYNHCLRIAVRGISAQWCWPFRILPQRREILAEPTGRERPQRGRTTLSASDRAICFDDQQISVIARTGTLLLKTELVVRGQQSTERREDIFGFPSCPTKPKWSSGLTEEVGLGLPSYMS